jgi:hypothetical protein
MKVTHDARRCGMFRFNLTKSDAVDKARGKACPRAPANSIFDTVINAETNFKLRELL